MKKKIIATFKKELAVYLLRDKKSYFTSLDDKSVDKVINRLIEMPVPVGVFSKDPGLTRAKSLALEIKKCEDGQIDQSELLVSICKKYFDESEIKGLGNSRNLRTALRNGIQEIFSITVSEKEYRERYDYLTRGLRDNPPESDEINTYILEGKVLEKMKTIISEQITIELATVVIF